MTTPVNKTRRHSNCPYGNKNKLTGARVAAPSFLRRRDDDVDAERFHVDPVGAGRDAVEDEDGADGVRGVGYRLDLIVGEHDPGGRLDVRREYDFGFFFFDRLDDGVDREWFDV